MQNDTTMITTFADFQVRVMPGRQLDSQTQRRSVPKSKNGSWGLGKCWCTASITSWWHAGRHSQHLGMNLSRQTSRHRHSTWRLDSRDDHATVFRTAPHRWCPGSP